MQYKEALRYIENIQPLGFQLGLERIEILLERLGNPHKGLQCIHVAGTNGKGSACSMLRHILTAAGYQTGLYTSPHLCRYNERIQIDGNAITDEEFGEIAQTVAAACDTMARQGEGQPTVFEFLTAMAFYYFHRRQVDLVVLEVGLGGQFDATNVISNPLVCLIMSISMDHMEYLGEDLGKIAFEKGGIIKENCPVVLYSQSAMVYNVIDKLCKAKNAPLYDTGNMEMDVHSQNLLETIFSIASPYFRYQYIRLSLLGDIQIKNCAAVLLACYILQKQGFSQLKEPAIREGLSNTHWEGRMEILQKNPTVILDGAHNVDGFTMLAASLPKYFPNQEITLILGVLGDKEYEKMTETLLPCVNQIVLTEPANTRKLPAAKLLKLLSPYGKTLFQEEEIPNAYQKAKEITNNDGVILAAGSLYMIGAIREYIVNDTNHGGNADD